MTPSLTSSASHVPTSVTTVRRIVSGPAQSPFDDALRSGGWWSSLALRWQRFRGLRHDSAKAAADLPSVALSAGELQEVDAALRAWVRGRSVGAKDRPEQR